MPSKWNKISFLSVCLCQKQLTIFQDIVMSENLVIIYLRRCVTYTLSPIFAIFRDLNGTKHCVYFLLIVFLAILRRFRTQQKLNPCENYLANGNLSHNF